MLYERALKREQRHLMDTNYEDNLYSSFDELDPDVSAKYQLALEGDQAAIKYLMKLGVKRWWRNGIGEII